MSLRSCITRARRRAGANGSERGAALVEFALVLPILIALVFGIVEFSSAYHDSSLVSDATRAGGRVGSAQATNPDFAKNVVAAVNAAVTTLPDNAPEELWVYKANANGYPGNTNNFSSCTTNCIKYTWNSSSRQFNAANPQGGGWSASSHQVCRNPFDEIGVYLKIDHDFVTRLFGANITLTDHSVFRFEPVPTSVCAA